jgi:Ran GTPase-activating protein (RanGAP) involved in mRNA processing and transport
VLCRFGFPRIDQNMSNPPLSMGIVLKAGGPRTLVSESEAEAIRDRFTKQLSNAATYCWKLDLSCRAWTVPTLKIVLDTTLLSKIVPTVQVLRLDDIIASLETEQGLAVFEYVSQVFANTPHLHTLNMNDNAIGTRGVDMLAPLFTSLPALHSLHFENCGMSAEVAEHFCDSLLSIASRLTSLSLGRNQMGIDGAKAIGTLVQECLQLQHFRYDGSRPLREGTQFLCRGLKRMTEKQANGTTQLVTLDLNDCHLGSGDDNDDEEDADPIIDLVWVLERSPFLQTLIVRDAELEVPGLERILSHVHDRLCVLDIGGNGTLGGPGGVLIREYCIRAAGTMRKLVCDANELGDEGVMALAMGTAACESLTELSLEGNEITSHGAKALLLNPVPKLVTLDLQDNIDLPQTYAEQLQKLYSAVLVDEDLPEEEGAEEEEEEKDEEDVADLTSAMAASHI